MVVLRPTLPSPIGPFSSTATSRDAVLAGQVISGRQSVAAAARRSPRGSAGAARPWPRHAPSRAARVRPSRSSRQRRIAAAGFTSARAGTGSAVGRRRTHVAAIIRRWRGQDAHVAQIDVPLLDAPRDNRQRGAAAMRGGRVAQTFSKTLCVARSGAGARVRAPQLQAAVVVSSKLSSESAMIGQMIRLLLNADGIATVDRTTHRRDPGGAQGAAVRRDRPVRRVHRQRRLLFQRRSRSGLEGSAAGLRAWRAARLRGQPHRVADSGATPATPGHWRCGATSPVPII